LKADWSALAVRWAAAWFLLCVVLVFLAGAGAAQSFLDSTQEALYRGARLLAWAGLGLSAFVVLPLSWGHRARRAVAAAETAAFAVLSGVVLVWGAWLHPGAGGTLW